MSQVAKRYAEALFQLAQEKQILAEVGADLKELATVLKDNKELLTLLAAPKLSTDRKKVIVSEIFSNAHPVVLNTLQLLIDKKRVNDVQIVAEEFQTLASSALGATDATVYSTRPLTDAENAEISSAFAKLVGKGKLNITNVIEPALIGGIRVQIGNYIYDSTVVSKLESLKRTLVG